MNDLVELRKSPTDAVIEEWKGTQDFEEVVSTAAASYLVKEFHSCTHFFKDLRVSLPVKGSSVGAF